MPGKSGFVVVIMRTCSSAVCFNLVRSSEHVGCCGRVVSGGGLKFFNLKYLGSNHGLISHDTNVFERNTLS